jgi:23S rRNA pseudouridine1911/1915/1917 synthase
MPRSLPISAARASDLPAADLGPDLELDSDADPDAAPGAERPPTPVTVTLPADAPADRLDRALARVLPHLSRSRLKNLILAGAVHAADGPADDPARTAQGGQIFALFLGDPETPDLRPEAIALDILHEDPHLIVVDKPAGMVVHPAPGNPAGTLVNALLGHCGASLAGIGGVARPGVVHRLDKDTSGLIVCAKTEVAHHGLVAQFQARTVDRRYLAVAWGWPKTAEGRCDGPIGRDPRNRQRMAITAAGRPAATRWRRLAALAGGRACLLECRLESGRTHQVRVHLTAAGHPLVGDPLYGRAPRSARDLVAAQAFPRQALHAARLGFTHPATGAALLFERPPPADMAGLIANLSES